MNLHTEDGGEQIDQPISDPISVGEYIRTFVIALAACIAAFVAGSVFIHAWAWIGKLVGA